MPPGRSEEEDDDLFFSEGELAALGSGKAATAAKQRSSGGEGYQQLADLVEDGQEVGEGKWRGMPCSVGVGCTAKVHGVL